MRKITLSIMAAIGALGLTGCGPQAQVGTLYDPGAEAQSIVEPALEDLVDKPVLEFEGAVDELSGSGNPATIAVDVVEDGTSFGTAEVDGTTIDVMTIDGVYYVSAPKSFWIAQGVDKAYAKKIDGKWTQVDPGSWFDPGTLLTAQEYSDALQEAMEAAGALDVAPPEPIDLDGVKVYPIPVGSGTVYITVDTPHTVVRVDKVEVVLGSDGSSGFVVTTSTDIGGVDAGKVEKLMEDVIDAVKDISAVYDNGADLQLSESDSDFDCDNNTFKCTFKTAVTADLRGDYHIADEVKVTFNAKADGGKLGTKKCDDSKSIDIGETAKLSCTVSFSVPADGVSYQISPSWEVSGVATFHPDTDSIVEDLEKAMAGILDEYN